MSATKMRKTKSRKRVPTERQECSVIHSKNSILIIILKIKLNSMIFKAFLGEWSLDRISLDIFSWSKFSVKLGVRSKLFFSLDRILFKVVG